MQIMFLLSFLLIHQVGSHQRQETLLFCQNEEKPNNRDLPIISILVSPFRLKQFSSILFSDKFDFVFSDVEDANLVITTKQTCPHNFQKLENISSSPQFGEIFTSDFINSFDEYIDDDDKFPNQLLQGFPKIIITFFIIIFTFRFIYLNCFVLKGFSLFQPNLSFESENSNLNDNNPNVKIRIMRTPEIKSNKDPDLTSNCPIKSNFVNLPNRGSDMVIYEQLIIPITKTRCISIEWLDKFSVLVSKFPELKSDVQLNFDDDSSISNQLNQLVITPHQVPNSFPSLELSWKDSKIMTTPKSKPTMVPSTFSLPSKCQYNYNPFGYYPFHLSFYANIATKLNCFLHSSEKPFDQYARFLVEFLDVYAFGFYLQIDKRLICIQLTFNTQQDDSDPSFNKEHLTHQIEEYVKTTELSADHIENKCNYATFSGFRFESYKVDFGGQLFTTIILRKAQKFVLRVDERNQLHQAASILPAIYLSIVGDFNLLQVHRFNDICSRFDDLAFTLQHPSYSIGSIDGVCGSKLIAQFERIIKQKYKNEQIANLKNKSAIPEEIKNLTDTLLNNNTIKRRNFDFSQGNASTYGQQGELSKCTPKPRRQTIPTSTSATRRSVRFAYSPQVEIESSNSKSKHHPTGSILKNPLSPDSGDNSSSNNRGFNRKLALDVVKIERVESQFRTKFVSYLGARRPEGMKMALFNETIGFFDHNFKIIPTNSMFNNLDIPGQKLSNIFDESALLANKNGIFTIETKNKSERQFLYSIFDDPKNPTSEAMGSIVELKNPYQGVFLNTNSPIIVLIIDSLTGERVWSISQNSKYLSLASIAKQCHPGDRALFVESIEHARNVQPIQLTLNVRLLIDQDSPKNLELIEMNSTDTPNIDLSLTTSETTSTMFNSFANATDSDHDFSQQFGINDSFLNAADEESSTNNPNIAYNSSDNVLEYMNMYQYYSVSIFRRDSRYFVISLYSIDNLKKRVETFRALDETITNAMRLAKITIWNFEDSNTPIRVYTTLPPFIMQLSMNWTTLHYNVISTNILSSSASAMHVSMNRKSQDLLKPPFPKKDRERAKQIQINELINKEKIPKPPNLTGSNPALISTASSPLFRRAHENNAFPYAKRYKEKRRSHFDEYTSQSIDNEHYENDVVRVFKRALATGESFSIEAPLIFNDIRWMTLRGISNGIPGQLLGTATDITQTKDAEDAVKKEKQRAIEANSSKMRFLANMSHEIRNPLNGMSCLLELLLRHDLTQEQDDLLECVKASFLRLLELLNDTLDLAKIEQGKMQLSNVTFSPLDIVATPLKKFNKLVHKKKLHIYCQTAPNLPLQVKGDPHFLGRIFSNLLSNAIKFTEEGFVLVQISFQHSQAGRPRNTLDVTQQPFLLNDTDLTSQLIPSNDHFSLPATDTRDLIKISVYDSGIGIPPENQDLIFEAFTQGDPSVRRLYGGMGVGLALIKRMIAMIGGNITLNTQVNVGSTFTASIPVYFEYCPFIPRTLIERHYKVLLLSDVSEIYDIALHCSYYNIEICLNERELNKSRFKNQKRKKRRSSAAPRKGNEQKRKVHSHSESENLPPKTSLIPTAPEKSTNSLYAQNKEPLTKYNDHKADDDDNHSDNPPLTPHDEQLSQQTNLSKTAPITPLNEDRVKESQSVDQKSATPSELNPTHGPTVTFIRPFPQTKIKPYNSFTNISLNGPTDLTKFNPPTSSEFTTSTEDDERDKDDSFSDGGGKQIDDDLLCIFINLMVEDGNETIRAQNRYLIQEALSVQALHNDCFIVVFTSRPDEFNVDDIFSSKQGYNIDRRRNKKRDFYVFKNPPQINVIPKFFRSMLWNKARARRRIKEKKEKQTEAEEYEYSYYYEEEDMVEEDHTEKEEKPKQTIPPEILAKLTQLTEPQPTIETSKEDNQSDQPKSIINTITIPVISESRQRRRGTSSVIPSSSKLAHCTETKSNSNINMDEIPSFSKQIPLSKQPNPNRNSHSQIPLAAELIIKENMRMFSGSDSNSSKKKKKKALPDLSGIRILAADDSKENRTTLESIFKNRNALSYKVLENGAEVLAELQRVSNHDSQNNDDQSQREEYDIVILDQHMPILDGPSCAQAIRKSESSYSRIPIIAMTGSVMKEDEELCIESGMNLFLSKPVRLKDTVEAIRTLVSNRF